MKPAAFVQFPALTSTPLPDVDHARELKVMRHTMYGVALQASRNGPTVVALEHHSFHGVGLTAVRFDVADETLGFLVVPTKVLLESR